jgi:hypothetical protein
MNETVPTTQAVNERVLVQFMQGHATLVQLAGTLDMSLGDLASWSMELRNWRMLSALSRLSDLHTRLAVGRFRITAAAHLLNMASGKDSTELARRACADLLEAKLDSPSAGEVPIRRAGFGGGAPGWPAGVAPMVSAPSEREMHKALEEIGRMKSTDENDVVCEERTSQPGINAPPDSIEPHSKRAAPPR